jgi:preprotein translocase subunit SecG
MRIFVGAFFIVILIVLGAIQRRAKKDSNRLDFTIAAIFAVIAIVAGSFAG